MFSWNVETGDRAHFRIAQRGNHPAEIIGTHAHVAIADDHHFVRGVAHQTREFGDFVVGGDASRTIQNTDAALRENQR